MPTIERTIGEFHDASHGRIRKIGVYRGPVSMGFITNVPGAPFPTTQVAVDSFRPRDIGLSRIEFLLFSSAIDPSDPFGFALAIFSPVYYYDLQVVSWGGAVSVGQNLSNYVCRFEAIGI
jgi:hypothetical protein